MSELHTHLITSFVSHLITSRVCNSLTMTSIIIITMSKQQNKSHKLSIQTAQSQSFPKSKQIMRHRRIYHHPQNVHPVKHHIHVTYIRTNTWVSLVTSSPDLNLDDFSADPPGSTPWTCNISLGRPPLPAIEIWPSIRPMPAEHIQRTRMHARAHTHTLRTVSQKQEIHEFRPSARPTPNTHI